MEAAATAGLALATGKKNDAPGETVLTLLQTITRAGGGELGTAPTIGIDDTATPAKSRILKPTPENRVVIDHNHRSLFSASAWR